MKYLVGAITEEEDTKVQLKELDDDLEETGNVLVEKSIPVKGKLFCSKSNQLYYSSEENKDSNKKDEK